VPEGIDILVSDFAGHYELGPDVVVAPIPWDALEDHGSFAVREAARRYRTDGPRRATRRRG
jgi:hypothetical protein